MRNNPEPARTAGRPGDTHLVAAGVHGAHGQRRAGEAQRGGAGRVGVGGGQAQQQPAGRRVRRHGRALRGRRQARRLVVHVAHAHAQLARTRQARGACNGRYVTGDPLDSRSELIAADEC